MTDPYSGTPASGPQFLAREVIAQARQRVQPQKPLIPAALMPKPDRPELTDADRRELAEAIKGGALCRCCAGVHAGTELACPRLAAFELDGDGKVRSGAFWPDGQWDTSRVVFAEEASAPPPAPVPPGLPDYAKIAELEKKTGLAP